MKRLLMAGLMLAMSACATTPGSLASPGTVANQTKLDEQAGLAVTLAYETANRLGLLAIRSGAAKGTTAARIKALDAQAYSWVAKVRQAYEAGNAADYASAISQVRAIVAEINTTVG